MKRAFGILALALLSLSVASVADARERARDSVLARVRAGGFASNCAATPPVAGEGSGLIDTSANAPPVAREGVRVLPAAAATQSLRAMLQRLEAVQPPPAGVTPALWIEDSPEIDARQRGAGDIYVTRGTLETLTVETRNVPEPQITADVAFILAHEYAHVLMCHYNRVRGTTGIGQTIDTLTQVAVAGQYIRSGNNQGQFNDGVAETMAAQSTLQTLNSKLVNPAWGREQERDADYLAVELMAAAGMPTDSVPDLLASLNTAEANFSSQMNPIMQRMSGQIASDLQQAVSAGSAQNIDWAKALERAGRQILVGTVLEKTSHFHEPANRRAERVVAMMEFLGATDSSAFSGWAAPAATGLRTAAGREFATPKLAFEANRMLAQNDVQGGCAAAQRALAASPNYPSALVASANCAVATNDARAAGQHLNRLTQSPYAVPEDFVTTSLVWATARNRQSAGAVIDRGVARFGADSFYVPRMRVAAAFSDASGVVAVRDQCVGAARNEDVRSQCTQAAAQLTGQPQAAAETQTPAAAQTLEEGARQLREGLGGIFNRN